MMITYKKGDLFSTDARVIVHGCNAQGKMGSGVAKQIKEKFPHAYNKYKKYYDDGCLKLGMSVEAQSYEGIWICNCVTQEYYGYDGKLYTDYNAVKTSLRSVGDMCHTLSMLVTDKSKYSRIAMPKIGCGLGGGDWEIVSKIIEEELKAFEVEVWEL